MKVKYQRHKLRTERAKETWLKMAKDYNDGISPDDIIKKYINPRTKKNYTRAHLYWVLKQVSNIKN
jgi:hypothetical protein